MNLRRNVCLTQHLAVAFALCGLASAADVVGYAEFVEVSAFGTPSDQARQDLRADMQVHAKERVETVKQSEVLIEFLDGTTLGMGVESAIVLDELFYDPNRVDNMVLSMN